MELIKSILVKLYRKFIKISKRAFIILLIVSLAGDLVFTSYKSFKGSYSSSMTVTFNYELAKMGLNPDGSRFNIGDIKSDEVLRRAIDILGDDTLSAHQLKGCIYIDSRMPLSAITQASAAIAADSNYRYNPSEFVVSYTQKNIMGKNNTKRFMRALSEAYSDFFAERYADKNVILKFDGNNSFPQYDYKEIQQILFSKCTSMMHYIDSHSVEDSAFRSQTTGYSFSNIASMLLNLRDKDIAKLDAFIVQNKVSKDTGKFIRKKQYLIEDRQTDYKKKSQASEIQRAALHIYDPYVTGVAFIPSVDSDNEYYMSRTKTGIDNIVKKSYSDGVSAAEILKKIDENRYLINKFSGDSTAPSSPADKKAVEDSLDFSDTVVLKDVPITDNKTETVNAMIVNICVYLEKISSIALLTDNDYIADKTNDYVSYRLPSDGISFPIKTFAIGFVFIWVVGYIAIRLRENILRLLNSLFERVMSDTTQNGEE